MDANIPGPHLDLSLAYQLKSNYAESVEEFARWRELSGDPRSAAVAREGFAKGGWNGFLRDMTGRQGSPDFNLNLYGISTFYVALGDSNKALEMLNAAYEQRENDIAWLKFDPRFDTLRDDPRFQELIKKVGFPE